MFFEIFKDFSLKSVVQKNNGYYLNKGVEWYEDSKVIKYYIRSNLASQVHQLETE